MGNGNKIKINKPEVKLFLHGDLLPTEAESPVLYNLEAEYAKTRSKKFSFILTVLLICIASVTLLTYGLARYLQSRNETMEIDIKVFEDLNLKNLLDVVSQTQASLEQVSIQKNQLEIEYSTKLKQAEIDRDSQIQLLETLSIGNATRQKEMIDLNSEYEALVEQLNLEYIPQIRLYETQMEDYTKQLASYDTANVELAQQQEAAINSQRQLYELEKQELIADYDRIIANMKEELNIVQSRQLETQRTTMTTLNDQHSQEISMLDPVFVDDRAASIIDKLLNRNIIEPVQEMELLEDLGAENIGLDNTVEGHSPATEVHEKENSVFSVGKYTLQLSDPAIQTQAEAALVNIASDYNDYNYLAGFVSSIPWANSLTEYVQSIIVKANEIGNDIIVSTIELLKQQDETIVAKTNEISTKNEIIDNLENNLSAAHNTIATKDKEIDNKNQALAMKDNQLQENMLLVEQLRIDAGEQKILMQEMQAQLEPLLQIKEAHEELLASFDEKARLSGDAGYILRANDSQNIGVYISPSYKDAIRDGMKAYAFREKGTVIGELTLYKNEFEIYAQAEESVTEELRVNDVILLELVQ